MTTSSSFSRREARVFKLCCEDKYSVSTIRTNAYMTTKVKPSNVTHQRADDNYIRRIGCVHVVMTYSLLSIKCNESLETKSA
jgi:hypothetical protein